MIKIPDNLHSFDFENNFYLSCSSSRIGKLIAHYELYKMIVDLPGSIIECGVFKGVSFSRFCMFRDLIESTCSRKIIGFDVFGKFPETEFGNDKEPREKFIKDAGEEGISEKQLLQILSNKGISENVELVKGDIVQTIPNYIKEHPELKISLLNLDTDIYEPAVVILEHLWPHIVKGGILMLDDYGVFPGETKAVDSFLVENNVKVKKLSFCATPCFVVK